jgi:hypothetical protein
MPQLSRSFIKAGLIYFVLALLIGVLMAAQPMLDLPGWIGALYPVYIHLLIVGWVTQLIVGVMYWMFPKYSKESPRGSVRLGWATFGLLNTGLILRTIGEPLTTLNPELNTGWMLAVSAILQCCAGWAVVINTWGRIKER